MIIETKNSTYEVDFAESRVRRLAGVNPTVLGVEDDEWKTFLEAKRIPVIPESDAGHFWFFTFLGDPSWIRTSRVMAESAE